METMLNSSWNLSTATMAQKAEEIIQTYSKISDPYHDIKKKYNNLILKMIPKYEQIIFNSDDPLHTAVKLAIAGNVIDFGVHENFNIENTIANVLETTLSIDSFNNLRNKIEKANKIIYLADNAGEIVFDMLLIQTMVKSINKKQIDKITFVVKDHPVSNDVTMEDVCQIGLDKFEHLDFLAIGIDSPKSKLNRTDQEFVNLLKTYDVVISKGQANYEDLFREKYIFFLLLVKCQVVGNHLGVPVGSTVLKGPD